MSRDEPIDAHEFVSAALKSRKKSLKNRLAPQEFEVSAFIGMGDYWIIRYQGKTAILKAARGLDYIAYLLHSPGREVHVRELLGTATKLALLALGNNLEAMGSNAVATNQRCSLPILDSQAKASYKRRIDELRKDAEEAERFNDSYRAAKSRCEIDAISQLLAAAVGLGGRNRAASSDTERARSAITKRIKDATNKIGNVLPPLGHHLATRIKTGYFCSYKPNPARRVSWRF